MALRRAFPALFFLVFFGLFLYKWYPHLGTNPVHYDLWEHYHDSFYRGGLLRPFDFRLATASLGGNSYFMPLRTLVYNFLFLNFGYQALPFWILGFFLYAANALLTYCLAVKLLAHRGMAVLAGLLPALHPASLQIAGDPVWITAQPFDAFFLLSALIFFVDFSNTSKKRFYFLSLLFFVLGILAKISNLIFIPAALLIQIFLFQNKEGGVPGSVRFSWMQWFDRLSPFLLAGAAAVMIQIAKYPASGVAQQWGGAAAGEFTIFRLLDFMTWLFFPGYLQGGRSVHWVLAALWLVAGFLLLGNSKVRLLVLWILASLVPFTVSNFRETATLFRYLYYAAVPFSMLVSFLVFRFIARIRIKRLLIPSHAS